MDAAQTNTKKIAFFLATALLLTAPFHASAQTLNASNTSVTIGSSSCNNYQNVQLTSSDGTTNIQFTVAIQYSPSNLYGQWLYASIPGNGSTDSASTFASSTGTGGNTLTIGLNTGIGAVTPVATVVVTPTNPAGSPINITVYYTQNSSCGGNTGSASNSTLIVTPGNVSLTAGLGNQQSQTLVVQNRTGNSLTFTATTTGGTWLTATTTSTSLSPNGSASVTVTGNAANLSSTGTYTGSVFIQAYLGNAQQDSTLSLPVSFVVGTGGGTPGSGTLTLAGSSSNVYYATFSYVSPSAPGPQCIGLQDSTSGAASYYFQVTTSNGGNWLLANNNLSGTTQGLLAASSNACINLTMSNAANQLASGAYQGTVVITSSSGSTATIYVNLFVSGGAAPGISVSPSLIYTFPNVSANSNVVQSEAFYITAANGYTLGTAIAGSSPSWFSMSTPSASTSTEGFTVTANSNGLSAGVYSATITVQSSGTSAGTTTITIVLPVGQAGTTTTTGNTTSVIEPTSLAFQQQSGSSFWTSSQEAQTITITGQQGTQWSASISYNTGSNWLIFDAPSNASGTFGSGPVSLVVDLFNGVASLSPQSTPYSATVYITTPSGTYSVPVSLFVTSSNVLLGKPALSTFATSSGSSPSNASVTVVGSDNTGANSSPIISAGNPTATWITATTNGNTLTITANPSGLGTGVYAGTIPVTANASSYPYTLNYPVVLIVNGGGTTGSSGPLTLSPTPVSFTNVTGQLSLNLSVTAATATNFTVGTASETSCTNASWLQVATGTFTAYQSSTLITVTVNPAGIANGTTCSGVITLVSTTTQTVQVTMTVGTSTGGGNVTVSPLSMTFPYTQGQTVPAAQTATIVNVTSGTASIPFTVTTAVQSGVSNWLQTSATSGSTPYNNPGLSVSVAPGSLQPNTYMGTVTITPNGGTAQVINVTLTITGNQVVTATPTTLSLSYQVGSNSPTGTIAVSGGGSAAPFTATAVSSAGWLQVSPTSGTTTNSGTVNLTASLVPSVLSTLLPTSTGSPLTGTITVAGTSPATGTTTVNVSLTITAPLPQISGITNAASGATGAVSPGELISIFAPANFPIGPATSVQLNSATCASPCTQVPTTMGGVQVKFLPGGTLAPLIFVNSGQINAVVPYQVAGLASTSVEVSYLNQTSNAFSLNVAATAPGLFTANSSGTGPAAVLQYDASGNYQGQNLPSKPASKGWYLVIYMTGEGLINVSNPSAATGTVTQATSSNPPTPQPFYIPSVLIGGQPATVPGGEYGEAPGIVSGVLQVNAIVPPNAGTGAVSLSVSLGTGTSQAGVTVYLQ